MPPVARTSRHQSTHGDFTWVEAFLHPRVANYFSSDIFLSIIYYYCSDYFDCNWHVRYLIHGLVSSSEEIKRVICGWVDFGDCGFYIYLPLSVWRFFFVNTDEDSKEIRSWLKLLSKRRQAESRCFLYLRWVIFFCFDLVSVVSWFELGNFIFLLI